MTAYVRAKQDNEWQTFLDTWEALVRSHPEVDELGARIGAAVLQHLAEDGAFLDASMHRFLTELRRRSAQATSDGDIERAKEEYKQTCYRAQRQGQRAPRVTKLFHIVPEAQLRAVINAKYGEAPDAHSDHWRRFRDAIDRRDTTTALKKLDGVQMHPLAFQVFATHPLAQIVEPWQDASTWDATTACAVLGLSTRWDGYAPGDRLWMMEYALVGREVITYVPTSADADWRSIFRPAADRAVQFGMTVTLGHIRRQQEAQGTDTIGMPELVHACPLISTRGRGGVSARPGAAPRFLGAHAGW